MTPESEFDRLVREAQQAHFSGWDFSCLQGRWEDAPLPWDYVARVRAAMRAAQSMLDMGTGGGELLASLAPFPPETWATEAYLPNIPIAERRLAPLGVRLRPVDMDDRLPFGDATFDLLVNRHDSFDSAEVKRVLKPGGLFITQQVGGKNNLRLNELLQDEVWFEFSDWVPARAVAQLEGAGLEILDVQEAFPEGCISDIGAIVYYLKAIPWQIEGFSVEAYRGKLLAIHEMIRRDGSLRVHSHRFYIEARRPAQRM